MPPDVCHYKHTIVEFSAIIREALDCSRRQSSQTLTTSQRAHPKRAHLYHTHPQGSGETLSRTAMKSCAQEVMRQQYGTREFSPAVAAFLRASQSTFLHGWGRGHKALTQLRAIGS